MSKVPKPPLLERLRGKKARQPPTRFGVCWYLEPEWSLVKEMAVDPELLEDTYPEWVAMAEAALKNLSKTGSHITKILVNADELRDWCIKQKMPNNSAARAAYAVERLGEGGAKDVERVSRQGSNEG
jgi:hypothetical protein